MYFDAAGGTPEAAASAVGDYWDTVDPLIQSAVSWAVEAEVALIDPATGTLTGVDVVALPPSGTGTDGGAALPFVTQVLNRWSTGVAVGGRLLKGKTFIGALSSVVNDHGNVSTTAQGHVQDASDAIVADADCTFVIWSRVNHTFAPVAGGSCWSSFAELRSRRD
jgi:hypothetical protein